MESYGIKWIMFHGHLDCSQKLPFGGRPNTKLGDHGNMHVYNCCFFLFYHGNFMASLTLAVMVMKGLVLHRLFCMVFISGSYLVCFCVRAWSANQSRQYVNTMSWTMSVG